MSDIPGWLNPSNAAYRRASMKAHPESPILIRLDAEVMATALFGIGSIGIRTFAQRIGWDDERTRTAINELVRQGRAVNYEGCIGLANPLPGEEV